MIVSDRQIDLMTGHIKKDFVKKMMIYVQEKFESNCDDITRSELEKEIESLVNLAEQYLLYTHYHTKLFITYNYHYRWNGNISNKNILTIFNNREYSANEKFEEVRNILSKQEENTWN